MIGAQVHGLSIDIPTNPSLFIDLGGEAKQETTWLDVCDTESVEQLIKTFKPNFIFHLAAQPIVGQSYLNPRQTWHSNTLGTVSLLEAVRRSELRDLVVIMVTSDKVYKNNEWVWGYRESDELGGYDPYSASKAAAELAIRSYSLGGLLDGSKVVSVRAGNVVGGGDWAAGRVVPDLVRAWLSNQTMLLRNPKATRPWQHVLEPLGGYLLSAIAASKGILQTGESLNFGPSEVASKTVGEVVDGISRRLSPTKSINIQLEQTPIRESGLLALSSEKAKSLLGWYPVLNFEKTLDWIAEWYSKYPTNASDSLVSEQIQEYQSMLEASVSWGQKCK
jgi:CDP-glucose 4,6-dehydratase